MDNLSTLDIELLYAFLKSANHLIIVSKRERQAGLLIDSYEVLIANQHQADPIIVLKHIKHL